MIFQVLVWLFAILLVLSLLLILIGFFNPRVSLFWYKKKRTRLRSFLSYSALSLLFLILFVFAIGKYEKEQAQERQKVEEAKKRHLNEERNIAAMKLEKAEKEVERLSSLKHYDQDGFEAVLSVYQAHGITFDSLAHISDETTEKLVPEIVKMTRSIHDSHRQELEKLSSEIEVTRKRINKIDILLSQYY